MNPRHEQNVRSLPPSWALRAAVACVLLVVLVVAIFVSVRLSYYPVSVVLQDVAPAGMVDATGKGMWQVTVVMTNSEVLQFEPNSITIEAKKSSWVTAGGHLSGFWSGLTTGLIFVVPPGTTHYRIRFAYQREMLRWRIWDKLGQRGRTFIIKCAPGISARLWPRSARSPFNQPPIWKHAMVVSALPRTVDSEPF
jgi:hypothetical protein